MNPVPPEPALAAPGAGLPALELCIARIVFAVRSRRATPESIHALIRREQDAIAAIVRALPPPHLATRVLIPRPRGLEDSSRHWSVLMTLEHLRIVNTGVVAFIGELLAGRVPARAASTATVKPTPHIDASVIDAFAESCIRLDQAGDGAPDLRTPLRHPHPWFGPLDAFGWKFLGATHLGLHRRQLELIRDRLPRP